MVSGQPAPPACAPDAPGGDGGWLSGYTPNECWVAIMAARGHDDAMLPTVADARPPLARRGPYRPATARQALRGMLPGGLARPGRGSLHAPIALGQRRQLRHRRRHHDR